MKYPNSNQIRPAARVMHTTGSAPPIIKVYHQAMIRQSMIRQSMIGQSINRRPQWSRSAFISSSARSKSRKASPPALPVGRLAVLEALDREIQARGFDNDVQLTTCGCMGLCDEGPVMVVYPAGVWYRRVQPSDVPEIVAAHLRDGKPVDRLVWNDAPAMKAMSVEHGEKFRAAMAAREKAGMLPDRLDQMIRGYMPSRCILTALELDIFTAVGDGANAEQIGTKDQRECPRRRHAAQRARRSRTAHQER